MEVRMRKRQLVGFEQPLSGKVSKLIGYPVYVDDVINEGSEINHYIQNLQLQPGYPICVMDYRVLPGGEPHLMLVLPYADYQRLKDAECTVDEYIATSRFNFGYFWGSDSIDGIYWQPLEDRFGIHDTERISEYLRRMACRTYHKTLNYAPPQSRCEACSLDASACYCSELNRTGKPKDEFPEPDGRVNLVQALSARIGSELQFGISHIVSHTGEKDIAELYAGRKPNTVKVSLSRELLNELLYQPQERDWIKLAESLIFVRRHRNSEISATIDPRTQDKHESCLMFWGDEMPSEESKQPTVSKTPAGESSAKTSTVSDIGDKKPRGFSRWIFEKVKSLYDVFWL